MRRSETSRLKTVLKWIAGVVLVLGSGIPGLSVLHPTVLHHAAGDLLRTDGDGRARRSPVLPIPPNAPSPSTAATS